MANKWTLKKKAGKIDNYKNAIDIPNTNFGIYCDAGSEHVRLSVVTHGNMPTYFSSLEEMSEEQQNALENEVNSQLQPLIEQIGNKFGEIMKSKGFVSYEEKKKLDWKRDEERLRNI